MRGSPYSRSKGEGESQSGGHWDPEMGQRAPISRSLWCRRETESQNYNRAEMSAEMEAAVGAESAQERSISARLRNSCFPLKK